MGKIVTEPKKHMYTDDETEYNGKCKGCAHSFFNKDKAGRRMFKIGKCNVKNKYLVATPSVGSYPCNSFKKQ